MRQLILIIVFLFSISVMPVNAQQAASTNTATSKPVSKNPGGAASAAKQTPEKKAPRGVRVSGKMPTAKKELAKSTKK